MKRTITALLALFCATLFVIPALSQNEPANKDLTTNLHVSVGGVLPEKNGDGNLRPAAGVQMPPPPPPPPGTSVPIWSNTFVSSPDGVNPPQVWQYKMVGTDPSIAGAGTTNVPVVVIPLRINLVNGNASISPNQIGCVDTVSALTRVANSPLFNTNITWFEGNTVVGVTQFTDAFQRANFWSNVSTISPNFHVLLNPVQITPEAFLNVPATLGRVIGTACAGHPIGGVSINYVDSFIRSLISSLNIPPTTFTLVVTYDIGEFVGTNGLFLGYHNSVTTANGTWTYAIGSYVDPNIIGPAVPVNDISILSHEVGEWMDDPQVDNSVPPWGNLGQVQGCQGNLEVGDPLTGTNSTVFMNDGSTYTVQDLAFLSWFARDNPSRAVNGWYSTLNALNGSAKFCPPGGP